MDHLSKTARSKNMGRVKAKDTSPEIAVRKLVHSLGFRFRLHRKDLPGCPDLVFPGRKKVIFVHGCFWHQHDCPKGTIPKTNTEFWDEKLGKNKKRDLKNLALLKKGGWQTLVVWECEIKGKAGLPEKINRFLKD